MTQEENYYNEYNKGYKENELTQIWDRYVKRSKRIYEERLKNELQ